MINQLLIFSFSVLYSFIAQAASISFLHEDLPGEYNHSEKHTKRTPFSKDHVKNFEKIHVPIPEKSKYEYVLLSAEYRDISEAYELRKQIALNLPTDVKLVLLTSERDADNVRNVFLKWINPDQLILATNTGSYDTEKNRTNGFWARDAFPIPLKNKDNPLEISLIAHQYFKPFSAFQIIANTVSAPFIERDEIFVGGNLISDEDANCFTVNSYRLYDMTVEKVKNVYGCSTMTVFEYIAGIGDIDEVIKPLDNKIMLTNQENYVKRLENLGYKVILFPRLPEKYRTHINSLIIENIAFMPAYGIIEDDIAQSIYESLGYKVVKIPSLYLSDELHGSVHCQTMAYPHIEQSMLFQSLNLKEIF